MKGELFDMSGKVALVAGGAGYLGQAMCEGLAAHGAHVLVADLAVERAREQVTRLNREGYSAEALELDVANDASCLAAVEQAAAKEGRLDVLINATFGYGAVGKTVETLTAEEFDRANRVNLTGAFVLARHAAAAMPAGGSMVFFASMYGQVSPDPSVYHAPMTPNPIEYGVGKAGVIQMAKYLAVYWAPRGIRVNAISPGPFPFPSLQDADPDFAKRLSDKVPLGRVGKQEEIVGAAVFLASDASSYVNGETLNVDGGWTAW